MAKAGAFDILFEQFRKYLSDNGLIFKEGKIIDASFVDAPRQRNSRDENRRIKNGESREIWPNEPNKQIHKDVDAAWAKKRDETHFGYKAHAKVYAKSKFVDAYETTPANVHDSRLLTPLIRDDDKGQKLYLDAGYVARGDEIESAGMVPCICEKGYRNRPLTKAQKEKNRRKSKIRSRVEHVFCFMEGSTKGLIIRTIGLAIAKANVALTSLVYNFCRYCQIHRYHP